MTTTHLLTAAELLALEREDRHFELIEGVLIEESPPNIYHARVLATLSYLLVEAVEGRGIGLVFAGDAGFILGRNPDTVLGPDLAVILTERVTPEVDEERYLELAPDLAIEIVSPSNSTGEVEREVAIYLASGVKAVWTVYPRLRQVVVHRPGEPPTVLTDQDVLTDERLLPGFETSVSRLFAAR